VQQKLRRQTVPLCSNLDRLLLAFIENKVSPNSPPSP
jgi:hypothetical protein